jgi:hypothetical protein
MRLDVISDAESLDDARLVELGLNGGRCHLLTGALSAQLPKHRAVRVSRSFCVPKSNGTGDSNRWSACKSDPIVLRSNPYCLIYSSVRSSPGHQCRGELFNLERTFSHAAQVFYGNICKQSLGACIVGLFD